MATRTRKATAVQSSLATDNVFARYESLMALHESVRGLSVKAQEDRGDENPVSPRDVRAQIALIVTILREDCGVAHTDCPTPEEITAARKAEEAAQAEQAPAVSAEVPGMDAVLAEQFAEFQVWQAAQAKRAAAAERRAARAKA